MSGRAEINMTPMIDVLLVLLIIFMVITPTKSVGFPAAAPQPDNANAAAPPPSTIVIFAKGGGMTEVNHQPVAVAELGAMLLTVFHARPDGVVFVGGEPGLEFQHIARVIEAARAAGIVRVALLPKEAR